MKIIVVGPGALGCLAAAVLKHKTKDDIWLLDKSAARAGRIAESGIRIEGLTGSFLERVNCTARPQDIGVADLVVMCVKSHATEDACRAVKDSVGDRTQVMTLQNGIGNIQILHDHFGPERVIAGVTSHGATLMGIGHARHAGKGETIIGRADGRVLGEIRTVAQILTRAGFEIKISRDIDSVVWSKLIINAGINALGAITRLPNGRLLEHDDARQVMRLAVQEAVRVVKRKRIKLAFDDPIQKVESVCRATAGNVSSMLQDVLGRKRTEIDFINGAIVRQGKALGIATPVNEVLTDLVKTIETTYEVAVA